MLRVPTIKEPTTAIYGYATLPELGGVDSLTMGQLGIRRRLKVPHFTMVRGSFPVAESCALVQRLRLGPTQDTGSETGIR